uniref:DNA polymerase III, chi subunit n=1 Tax=Candidatus Kentrum sp. LFY TaxID=2126342 RepID=A0A450WEX2_9GAMM|nr:MAG: DNA polymerase III, chi subunit [Candidatus Kentron sp. LFY]
MHTDEKEPTTEGHDQLPRVDFYVLRTSGISDIPRMACRIIEKAWKSGHRIFVHTGTRFTVHQMDDLLWTFRAESFVPHAMDAEHSSNDSSDHRHTVVIGSGAEPQGTLDVMINLGDTVPPFFHRCNRVVEIVSGNAADRSAARERYRLYRGKGCALHTHDL